MVNRAGQGLKIGTVPPKKERIATIALHKYYTIEDDQNIVSHPTEKFQFVFRSFFSTFA